LAGKVEGQGNLQMKIVQFNFTGINLSTNNAPKPPNESLPERQDVSAQDLPTHLWQLRRLVMLKQARRLLVLL
jgi:hypothetical protein